MRTPDPERPGRSTSHPRPRPLALHRQARAGALAGRRVAAAADRRPQLGAHLARRAPHAPAQAAAAALPRRGDRALHADDRRGRRTGDRPLAAGRRLRLAPRMQAITLDVIMAGIFGIEGRPAPGTPEHAAAGGDQGPGRRLDQADGPDRRTDEHRPRGAGRADAVRRWRCSTGRIYAVIARAAALGRPR